MNGLFRESLYLLLPIFILFGWLVYMVGILTIKYVSRHGKQDEFSIPLGGFIGTVATAWGLSLGFVASDIWTINSLASQAVSSERSALSRLLGASGPEILDKPQLTTALADYQRAVVDDEWRGKLNVSPAKSVEVALQRIRRELIDLADSDIPSPIITQLIRDADALQNARNMRLAVGSTSVAYAKWYLVLLLTVLTSITVATAHADRVKGARRALKIYSATAATCLWILAIHASPYNGVERLKPMTLLTDPAKR